MIAQPYRLFYLTTIYNPLTMAMFSKLAWGIFGYLVVFGATLPAQANKLHPRLFLTYQRVEEIKQAIKVHNSHHQQAFKALKTRVNQRDWRVYGASLNDGNWNYARSYLAREAALMYLITNNRQYAQIAHTAISDIYNVPDPDNRLPDTSYGLSRATVGLNLAIAYDWAYHGWTQAQRDDVKQKINLALDAWENYTHPNLVNTAMASNWVAVCRGAELVMILAVYEEQKRENRYYQLKVWLKTHLYNAYGKLGLSQEGIGYDGYAGIFLLPAIYALRSVGDFEVEGYFVVREFWKLIMYAGAFMSGENSERQFLQSGVTHSGIGDEGWASLLLGSVPLSQLPYYLYFYDRHTGIKAPGKPTVKFERRRGATIWSLIYYPENVSAADPTGIFPPAVSDEKRGAYFFRSRWQDEKDILISIMADTEGHGNAWDQSEAFQLSLLAYNTRFMGGPGKIFDNPAVFSALLVDGEAQIHQRTIGNRELFISNPDGGYVIIDGGEKYTSLGVNDVKRHLLVKFDDNSNTAVLTTLDKIRDEQNHSYTWQLNLGDEQTDAQIRVHLGRENGLNTFVLRGHHHSYLKGWVLSPQEAVVTAVEPLQVNVAAADTDIWIVMIVGQGIAPVAEVTGTGMTTQLKVGDVIVSYDPESDRLITVSVEEISK